MNNQLALANPLINFLDKKHHDFTRADLIKVVHEFKIKRFTFHYTALDGKLKELKLPFTTALRAERILAEGERVDGSSLFKGLVDTSLSDLYVVPVYNTAFLNPFEEDSLDFVCRYLDRDHNLASHTTDNILGRAASLFRKDTGCEFHALGELEFFLVYEPETSLYPIPQQSAYHASSPHVKTAAVVNEMMEHIARITGLVKYAHSEVGHIHKIRSHMPELNGKRAEQHEIELLAAPVEKMADMIAVSRWIIRTVALHHGMLATFAPKLTESSAGNGFHFHMEIMRDGQSMMVKNGALSPEALRLIGGICRFAPTLSAFGNTVASSFLRLVPNHEAPTKICWSDMNRSALIRVPLGWISERNLAMKVNPNQPVPFDDRRDRQTVEIRSPDGSAKVHMLLAGLTLAARAGLTEDGMEERAKEYYVKGNIFQAPEKFAHLASLPANCSACADLLEKERSLYEKDGVFTPQMIDYEIRMLRSERDGDLARYISEMPADDRLTKTRKVMHKDIYAN
jgi:glutamine synthetase